MPESALCEVCATCPPICACPHFGQNATPVPTSPPHLLQKAIGCLPLRVAKEGTDHHEAEGYHCCPLHTSGVGFQSRCVLRARRPSSPETMRKQIRKADESFPTGRGRVEAVVESCVQNEIGTNRVGQRPQVPDCVAVQKRLREVPDFSRQREFLQPMRDRKRLPVLRPPDDSLHLLVEDSVCVKMKAEEVAAHKNQSRLIRRADIDVRCGPRVNGSKVTHRDRRASLAPRKQNALHARGYAARLPSVLPRAYTA